MNKENCALKLVDEINLGNGLCSYEVRIEILNIIALNFRVRDVMKL